MPALGGLPCSFWAPVSAGRSVRLADGRVDGLAGDAAAAVGEVAMASAISSATGFAAGDFPLEVSVEVCLAAIFLAVWPSALMGRVSMVPCRSRSCAGRVRSAFHRARQSTNRGWAPVASVRVTTSWE